MNTKRFLVLLLTLLLCWCSGLTLAEETIEDEARLAVDDDSGSAKNKKGKSPLVAEVEKLYKQMGFHIPVQAPDSLEGRKPLYTANMLKSANLRDVTDEKVYTKLGNVPEFAAIEIYEVQPNWVLTQYKDKIGWLKRIFINEATIKAVDPAHTAPYGVQKPKYIATLTETSLVYNRPDKSGTPFKIPVETGAKIAVLDFEEGFAKVLIWRDYGYIDAAVLTDVTRVAPSDVPLNEDTPIAAFNSFFEHSMGLESNDSRVKNIAVSCDYMSGVIQPGESFDFNRIVGPYKKSKGYHPAPVLIDGGSQLGYGGGTCQSSSTMYNALLQLPHVAITYRRPHGPASAKYLPQHMDAAVGNSDLNFRFRNDYSFPIRIVAESVNGSLFIAVYKGNAE